MKRLGQILLNILLVVPVLAEMLFVSPNLVLNSTQTTQNGGGGANSLNSPEVPEIAPNFDDEKQENITYERRTFEQYLIDYSIPTTLAEIGQTTITGSGTLASPYQINSTQDFVFLANTKLLRYKYVEVNCDIIYNDESFDENGNPHGGDGVYYEWKNNIAAGSMTMDGNHHYFCGFFFKDREMTDSFALFKETVTEIKNLKMKNFYFDTAGQASGLCATANRLDNIIFESGYVVSQHLGSGIVLILTKQAINCENYATIRTEDYTSASGIAARLYNQGTIENCKNFGNIFGISNSGGICGGSHGGSIINCANFGDVVVENYHAGGILGNTQANTFTTIQDCNNYGNIVSLVNSVSGGMCGMNNASLTILNCNNYGKCPNQMLGYNQLNTKDVMVVTIQNCGAYAKETTGLIGNIHLSTQLDPLLVVNIEGCHIKGRVDDSKILYLFMRPEYNIAEINLKNNVVDVESNLYNMALTTESYDNKHLTVNIENLVVNAKIKNALTETQKQKMIVPFGSKEEAMSINIKNAIFNFDVDGEKTGIYYGDDFDGYCINWKTGKMTLGRASGKDFFQQKVTEDLLVQRGYEKRVR